MSLSFNPVILKLVYKTFSAVVELFCLCPAALTNIHDVDFEASVVMLLSSLLLESFIMHRHMKETVSYKHV